jgi:hypothetical protein
MQQSIAPLRKLNAGRDNKKSTPAAGKMVDQNKHKGGGVIKCQKKTSFFPMKLYQLLEDADDDSSNINIIVSWLPDGTQFKVHQPRKFCETIIKTYFKQSKFESFTRQVRNYRVSSARRTGHAAQQNPPKSIMEACIDASSLTLDPFCDFLYSYISTASRR